MNIVVGVLLIMVGVLWAGISAAALANSPTGSAPSGFGWNYVGAGVFVFGGVACLWWW